MEPFSQARTPSRPPQTPRTETRTNPPPAPLEQDLVPNPYLFDVYLRLRPTSRKCHENPRFLSTIPTQPTNVYVTPPPTKQSLHQKGSSAQLNPINHIDKNGTKSSRPSPKEAVKSNAIEKFSFAEVFSENSQQRDIFERCTVPLLIETIGGGIQKSTGVDITEHGRDCLLATMGVAGSGKTHTILGSRSQWGSVQMTLKVLFETVGATSYPYTTIWQHVRAGDYSNASITDIDGFLETMSSSMNEHLQNATDEARQVEPPDLKDVIRAVKGCMPTYCSYAIVVSMYEVYNERIYDLLDASSWDQQQQEIQRQAAVAAASVARTQSRARSLSRPQTPAPRPKTPQAQPPLQALPRRKNLPFRKCTSGHNREKRFVMGLKKIYVRNMEEATLLIEHAQTCRHASSTGANTRSSRGHAFVSIDIMRMYTVKEGKVSGVRIRTNTFTFVDLAGSERLKKTETARGDLEKPVEMGTLNKSMITFGKCLQSQGQLENGKPIIPPINQSKLTEVLLTNAFRSISPQKGVLIITADPQGDYTTTLKILRYAAPASEVNMPRVVSTRIVSTSGAVLSLDAASDKSQSHSEPTDEADPPLIVDNELIKRLVDRLEEAESRFREAEDAKKAAERQCTEVIQRLVVAKQRALEAEEQATQIEIQVREELTNEFEAREKAMFGAYVKRIKEEEEAGREFVDSKLELAMRGLELASVEEKGEAEELAEEGEEESHENGGGWDRVEELERENEELKKEILKLRRMAMNIGTPTPAGDRKGKGVGSKRTISEQTRKKVAFNQ